MEQAPIRALMIGAHPDDCEYLVGGLAAKYRAQGHAVRFVSVTNGNAGHHEMGGGPLAQRRLGETRRVSTLTGIEYEILDNDDGQLEADLATRAQIISLIRAFNPDLIFTHRTNDYHPDHRRTGILVQDASYLIRVPNICPLAPHLTHNPVILYLQDGFQKPIPFSPDVVVGIDDVFEDKVQMLHCHESQFYEWLPSIGGYAGQIPDGDSARLAWMHEHREQYDGAVADRFRDHLVARYGEAEGRAVRFAEAFEVSEYGRSLPPDEVARWFPL